MRPHFALLLVIFAALTALTTVSVSNSVVDTGAQTASQPAVKSTQTPCTLYRASRANATGAPSTVVEAAPTENGTVVVTTTFDLTANHTDFTVRTPTGVENTTATRNLTKTAPETYNAAGGGTVSLTVTVNSSEENPSVARGRRWTVTRTPKLVYNWTTPTGGTGCARVFDRDSPTTVTRSDTDEYAVATSADRMLFAHDITTETRTLNSGVNATVIVPDTAMDDFVPINDYQPFDAVFQSLNTTSETVNTTNSFHLSLFVVPHTASGAGRHLETRAQSKTLLVNVHYSAGGGVYTHEYIHTQQQFTTGEQLKWFTEASASYYEYRLLIAENPDPNYHEGLQYWETRLYPGAALVNESTWTTNAVPYDKGTKALIKTDAAIRANSSATLYDVFVWMNTHSGKVTYAEFLSKIGSLSTPETAATVDRYLTTKESITLSASDLERLNNTSVTGGSSGANPPPATSTPS